MFISDSATFLCQFQQLFQQLHEFHSTISEMIQREMVQKPVYVTHSFKNPEQNKNDEIYKYILNGLK